MLRPLCALSLVAAAAANSGCVSDFDASVDYFPDKVAPTRSALWTIEYFSSYKVVNLSHTGASIVAYQCGTPRPNVSHATQYVSVPVDTVAVTSTTSIPWLELIGARATLAAYTSSMSYVSSPCVQAMYAAGVTHQAYDASTWSRDDALLATLGVDVTIADTWSASAYRALVLTPEHEATNLAAGEYVKLFGALYNKESEANVVFATVAQRFACTAEAVATLGAARVRVLWASYYQGGWTVGSCPNYYCEIIELAGGDIVETNITGSVVMWGTHYLNNSEFLSVAQDADVLLYVGGNFSDVVRAEPATCAAIPAVAAARAYDNYKRGPNDWFESRIASPDAVLEDVAALLHPAALSAVHERVWFREPFSEPAAATLGDACDDWTAPASLLSDECTSPPSSVHGDDGDLRISASSFVVIFILCAVGFFVAVVMLVVGCEMHIKKHYHQEPGKTVELKDRV